MEPEIQIRIEGSGYAAEGRGFYVWDPDRREVEETVARIVAKVEEKRLLEQRKTPL